MHELNRKKDESVFIGNGVEVVILDITDGEVKLGIKAPKTLHIHKGEDYEIFQQIKQFNRESVYSADLEKARKLFSFRE